MSDIEYIRCGWPTVADILLRKHYLKRQPAGILACYAIVSKSNFMDILGAAVFNNGPAQYTNKYIHFARLWIDDQLGKNSESRFIGFCLRDIAKQYKNYEGVVSWADPAQGHTGAIYLASNFYLDAYSRATKRYVNTRTGRTIYERTYEGPKDKGEYRYVGDDERKPRYVYLFDAKKREAARNTYPHKKQ